MASSPTLIGSKIDINKGLGYVSFFASVAIITASILIIIIDFIKFDSSNNNQLLQTIIGGYIIIMSGLVLLLLPSTKLYSSNHILKDPNGDSFLNQLKYTGGLIISSMPLVLTFGVLLYITSLMFIFKNIIADGRVANEYYLYSKVSSILITAQLCYIIYHIITSFRNKISTSNITIYILTTVNFIIIGIIHVILKFFSTDG